MPATATALAVNLVAVGFLLYRLAPDVNAKPLYQDEALAGLVSAEPLSSVVRTVIRDRGGAPLHFVLAHVALTLDPSPAALRWLSVVFALATVPLCYDLGRRLAGPLAGGTAAVVAASSQMLGIYGTFGRMYSLFAFTAALAVDLFVRATERRTRGAVLAAAAAAWLLPAVHPFGIILVAAEAGVALVLWRGKPLRAVLPVVAIVAATIPFVLADLRLADRYSAGLSGQSGLVTPFRATYVSARALGSFAGGREPLVLLFFALAALGFVVLAGRRSPFAALACVALVVPPVVLVLGRSTGGATDHLEARQLIFWLPLWAALIGVGTARAVRDVHPALRVLSLALLCALALLAPAAIADPRTAPSGTQEAMAAPAAWLLTHVERNDVLFPNSPVFLAALHATHGVATVPREEPSLVLRAVRRATLPIGSVLVAVPLDQGTVSVVALRRRLGAGFEVRPYRRWLIIRAAGPFRDRGAVVVAAARALSAARASIDGQSVGLEGYFHQSLGSLRAALRVLRADQQARATSTSS